MGDNDSVDIVAVNDFVYAVGQLEPNFMVHGLATDIGHLLTRHVRNVFQLRHGPDELLDGKGARLVSGVGLSGLGPCDCAARGEDFDFRQRPGGRR